MGVGSSSLSSLVYGNWQCALKSGCWEEGTGALPGFLFQAWPMLETLKVLSCACLHLFNSCFSSLCVCPIRLFLLSSLPVFRIPAVLSKDTTRISCIPRS